MDRLHPRATGRFDAFLFDAFLLGATVALFLGAWLSDYAYWSSHQVEWSTFASWLTAGGLVFGAVALVCAVIDLLRAGAKHSLTYTIVLLATWLTGFVNALVHARDAWAVMPTGLMLSCIVALLACVATWIGFSRPHTGDRP